MGFPRKGGPGLLTEKAGPNRPGPLPRALVLRSEEDPMHVCLMSVTLAKCRMERLKWSEPVK